MSANRTLFIAAEPALTASLVEQFAALEGYTLCESETPWPDAILLDDRTVAAQAKIDELRQGGFSGAIILISADDAPCPGVDATLERPFRFTALVAAIDQSLADRAAPRIPLPLANGVRLTEKEAAILARLSRAKGATVLKAELLSEVWGYGPSVSTRTLETHIHRLRRKIEADPAHPRRVVADAGGYRLAPAPEESHAPLPAP